MKYANKLVSTLAAFSMLFMLACGGGEDPTPDNGGGNGGGGGEGEAPGAVLIGKWVQGTVTGPAADNFTDFFIEIAATSDANVLNYTAADDEPLVFPTSGSFTLPADPNFETGAQVTRNDDVPVDIKIVDGKLEMKLTVDANSSIPTGNSRVAEIGGDYTFLLDKEQ